MQNTQHYFIPKEGLQWFSAHFFSGKFGFCLHEQLCGKMHNQVCRHVRKYQGSLQLNELDNSLVVLCIYNVNLIHTTEVISHLHTQDASIFQNNSSMIQPPTNVWQQYTTHLFDSCGPEESIHWFLVRVPEPFHLLSAFLLASECMRYTIKGGSIISFFDTQTSQPSTNQKDTQVFLCGHTQPISIFEGPRQQFIS